MLHTRLAGEIGCHLCYVRRHCVIQYHIHPPLVDGVDSRSPCCYISVMLVEKRQVQRRVGVCLPWIVDEGRAGDVDALYVSARSSWSSTLAYLDT